MAFSPKAVPKGTHFQPLPGSQVKCLASLHGIGNDGNGVHSTALVLVH